MKRGRHIKLWSLVAVGLAGTMVMVGLLSREPSFQGKSLSEWLEVYENEKASSPPPLPTNAPRPFPTEAVEAIRSMGQPAVDALLDRIRAEDPVWKLKLLALAHKQSLFKVKFQPALLRRAYASAVLHDLGSSASNAVPKLVEWLAEDEWGGGAGWLLAGIGRASVEPLRARLAHGDARDRPRAAQILGWIGPEAAPAVPQLIDSLSDTNQRMRSAAICALGAIGEPRGEIEPRLIGLLHQPEDALDAACGLVCMGSNSIPVFTRALTNENSSVRVAGAAGLKFWQDNRRRIRAWSDGNRQDLRQNISVVFDLKLVQSSLQKSGGGEPKSLAFVLVGNLDDPDPRVRELSAAMLAGFPTEAAWSVPKLETHLQDDDAAVRAAVRRSLEKLPGYPSIAPGFSPQRADSPPSLGPGPW
jgi:HEAT repeat protein